MHLKDLLAKANWIELYCITCKKHLKDCSVQMEQIAIHIVVKGDVTCFVLRVRFDEARDSWYNKFEKATCVIADDDEGQ